MTNISAKPCQHDLADEQIELVLRSGGARVWGSQDCETQPGTDLVTLQPGKAVARGVAWSGKTSEPHCAGSRRYPTKGRYQLFAYLSGERSKPLTLTLT